MNICCKFKVGDWIACEELNTALIINIDDDRYEVEFIDGNKGFPHIDYIDRLFHLWTIKDTENGDVLTYKNDDVEWILIYKNIISESRDVPLDVLKYHALFTGTDFYDSGIAGMISENYAS